MGFPFYKKGRMSPSAAVKRGERSTRPGSRFKIPRAVGSFGVSGGAADVDLDDYYTRSEVDSAIDAALETIDLSNYYTKAQVDSAIAGIDTSVAVGDTIGSAVNNAIVTISAAGLLANSDRFTFLNQEIILKHNGSNGSIVGGLSFVGRWAGVERTARLWFDNSAVDPMIQLSNTAFSIYMISNGFYISNVSGATIIRSMYVTNDQGGGVKFQCFNANSPALRADGIDGQSANILPVYGPGNVLYSGFDELGYQFSKKTIAPADGSLDNNEVKMYATTTDGAEAVVFKMKNSAGNIKTFTLPPD
jgi:hypothetical protein